MDYMTVFGCTPIEHTRTDWKDYWDLVYSTDDQMLFVSKETYKHNEPEANLVFDYNMILELAIVEEENEEYILCSNLYLVPTIKCIHQSVKERIIKSCCIEEEDIHLTDLLFEYQFPVLRHELPKFEFETFDENNQKISQYLLSASIASECINDFRGIELDQPENRIGTTGWDFLHGALHGIDPFQQSLERVSKMKGDTK